MTPWLHGEAPYIGRFLTRGLICRISSFEFAIRLEEVNGLVTQAGGVPYVRRLVVSKEGWLLYISGDSLHRLILYGEVHCLALFSQGR